MTIVLETMSITIVTVDSLRGSMNQEATAELIKLARRKRGGLKEEQELGKLKELLERGADPNAFTNKEQTILIRYMETPHSPECIKALLEHGADPNLFIKQPRYRYNLGEGETPLSISISTLFAAYALRWCKELVAAGANVNLRDSRKHTALDHVVAGLINLLELTEDALNAPKNDMVMYATTSIFFTRAKPLLDCGEVLIRHGAEAPIAKVPVKEIIDRSIHIWNRCVDWQNGTK